MQSKDMTVQELINSARNNALTVKKIIAAQLGVSEDKIDISKLKEVEGHDGN